MKIYTCALLPFEANEYFYTRDSGLLCKSFQNIGVESKVIMPSRECGTCDLYGDVVRGNMDEMHCSAWWRALDIDAVAIITWGHAKDTQVIRAAKEAGIKIILVTDDGEGRKIPILVLLQITWAKFYHYSLARRAIETIAKFPFLYVWSRWQEHGRYPQYRYADMITCWTARIAHNVKQGLRYHKKRIPEFLLGYPSSTDTNQLSTDHVTCRPPSIIAVGRWDAIKHKRPHFLMDVCKILLEKDSLITIHIYGKLIPLMHQVHDELPASQRERLILHGLSHNSEVLSCMRQCEVAICPSASDCGPVPMAEALCQGCSLVGGGNVVEWAAKSGYGTYIPFDTPVSFSEAVTNEIEKWKRGGYDRKHNASFWRKHYSATRFAQEIRKFVESKDNNIS